MIPVLHSGRRQFRAGGAPGAELPLPDAVDRVTIRKDGEVMKWREYQFIARWFPGQMRDHGGLLVEKPDQDPVSVGDSFSPSGIDDYCLMNRNLMREDDGYLRCFRMLREEMPPRT